MSRGYPTSPFYEEPEDAFSFSDATLLAFFGVSALALVAVFLLGGVCAEHRIAAALAAW